jgi:hypothetical protein
MKCEPCRKAQDLGQNVGSWAKSGFQITPSEILIKRIETCKSCEYLKKQFCSKCGCIIAIKSRMATAKCPDGKW